MARHSRPTPPRLTPWPKNWASLTPQVRLLWLHGDRAFAASALEKGFRLYGEAARLAHAAGGELLWPTVGYLDEHLDHLIATGQPAEAAVFCD
jgi:hypothetical protein